MKYPLTLRFKILTLASKIEVTDADGNLICFVRQKMFKFKEHVTVFSDREMTQPLCDIKSDRVIDFSAKYSFSDTSGREFGALVRKGLRSLWRAHYLLLDESGQEAMQIHEENPWAKVLDSILSDIPLIGLISGYVVHPRYLVSSTSGEPLFRVTKQPAFLEGIYRLDKLTEVVEAHELRIVMASVMMLLLERYRG